ncbi:MAG TPA: amidohydrolase family protein [Thermodesulfobacteriota bacterium]|nr:amidohydrolase family protein [Deltaproteobacteria bacterium]HNR13360.1 amidohydrolase family protein [Thermodesulfobacteriota bacterium]HNU71175.1 amidohydrolase family protein [Thermodesulfobacteriota bacterium]
MEVIDSHTHWGPSVTMWGVTVTSQELLQQARQSSVSRIVIMPFPSTAIADESINTQVLEEARDNPLFIPYYYIPEDLRPIPEDNGFYGGKWHWTRGVQDYSSNYDVLEDPRLPAFIERSEEIDLPIIFEEDLAFTDQFIKKTKSLKIIIPHLGMLGGNPLDFLASFKNCPHVHFDTALGSTATIQKFVQTIGPERILFGSDIPFGTMKNELEKVLELKIGEASQELILAGNLKRLIRLHDISSPTAEASTL